MIQQHNVSVTRTARYYTSGNLTPQTHEIWFVLHGYAQLAAPFLEQFEPLFSPERYIIAPEGLNRFYSRGFGGQPVANWMTSEFRESEIADYTNYLNQLAHTLIPEHYTGKIIVLGFSQGVATASRWLHQANFTPAHFIICSGDIAAELRNPVSEKLKAAPVTYITGNNDSLLREELKPEIARLMLELKAQTITFDGGHELNLSVLKKLSSAF